MWYYSLNHRHSRHAEANPEAGVEGLDVQMRCYPHPSTLHQTKIAILAEIAFGKTIEPSAISTSGISAITAVNFEYARLLKSTTKLLGIAALSGGRLLVYVSPVIVPLSSPLASAKGPGNKVVVNSTNMVQSTFVIVVLSRGSVQS